MPLHSPDVDIQYIGGADPEMVFLDEDYNEVEVCGYFAKHFDMLIGQYNV